MPTEPDTTYSERVVLIPPTRRDGEVTQGILQAARIECVVAHDRTDIERLVHEGLGALMVTDISLAESGAGVLLRAIDAQPRWSNLPVLLLCREGMQSHGVVATLQALGNVTVLDRPTSRRAMVSAVKAALRGRRWQYQIRDQIAELMQADRALRQADQRKDEFLATLAHELRNPLAPIKTGLELMKHVPLGGEQFVQVRLMMERQSAQLVKLIDELLDLSRISTGKVVLKFERLDLREVLRTAVESCQPMLQAASHRFTMLLPDHAVPVMGDPTRLAQSVSNLINNAVKYTGDNGRIGLSLTESDGEAVITVTDTGAGVPQEMLSRIFDMFTQVNRTLERSQGGLGIGLSLVRSLVALHGGRVSAASDGIDRGSAFTIRLPVAGPPPQAEDRPADAAPAAPPSRALRVLVVDDNADAADSLAMLLCASGHEARVEYSGPAALQTAAGFLPQAIFCDIGMPGMGGYEFASKLRHDDRFASTLLVAVSGWGAEEDKRRSKGAGFDAHLTKPASVDSVADILALL